MSQTILVKRSAVPGKVPSTTDLQLGELAMNTTDGKLYMKRDDGTASIKEIGADPFPSQAGKEGQFLKTDGSAVYWSDTGGTAMRVEQPSHGFSLGALLRYNGDPVTEEGVDDVTGESISYTHNVFPPDVADKVNAFHVKHPG